MTLDRKTAAKTLRRIATLMELHGENPYRSRAFAAASRAIERVEGDLGELIDSGEVLDIRGIGRGTADVLAELDAGRSPRLLVELEERTPEGLMELLSLAGLGPKKVRTLWTELDITTLGELRYACNENRLIELPGFGAKSQEAVVRALTFRLQARDQRLISDAWTALEPLLEHLSRSTGGQVHAAGSLRRGCETTDEALVVVETDDAERALDFPLDDRQPAGRGQWRGRLPGGLTARIIAAESTEVGARLLHATGSDDHVAELARRAEGSGMTLRPDGLWSGPERLAGESEQEIYERLGLAWIPPELREGLDEISRADDRALPELVTLRDIRGALHNHTTDSDGTNSLAEMAAAAAERGLSLLGIADHSPAAHYANGLDAPRLHDQCRRIDAWNAGHPSARLLQGLEADILPDGSLDIPDGAPELDYVVASVHSGFRMSRDEQTERCLRAVRHPACRVLGHPTGRLLLARPSFEVDLEAVLAACADTGVAVEINANPHRLDLDWRWARRAIELGIPLSINADAHAADGLDDLRWGVLMARKAGATADDVLGAGIDILEWL